MLAHGAKFPHTAHVALASPGDAAVHPLIFANDFSIELVALGLFLLEDFIAPVLEGREALLETARLAAVEPNGCPREIFEEAPVVADEQKRRSARLQRRFEPLDGGQVQVVRRLVEQQHVRLGNEHASQRHAARFSAR